MKNPASFDPLWLRSKLRPVQIIRYEVIDEFFVSSYYCRGIFISSKHLTVKEKTRT
jgi:hypothetical protein